MTFARRLLGETSTVYSVIRSIVRNGAKSIFGQSQCAQTVVWCFYYSRSFHQHLVCCRSLKKLIKKACTAENKRKQSLLSQREVRMLRVERVMEAILWQQRRKEMSCTTFFSTNSSAISSHLSTVQIQTVFKLQKHSVSVKWRLFSPVVSLLTTLLNESHWTNEVVFGATNSYTCTSKYSLAIVAS